MITALVRAERRKLQFANNIQLRLVLPPEPRRYWDELVEEHKKAPDHQAWQYSPDPFAAKKMVEERQTEAQKRRDEREASKAELDMDSQGLPSTSLAPTVRVNTKEFDRAPEVRMASALRELVEAAISKVPTLAPVA